MFTPTLVKGLVAMAVCLAAIFSSGLEDLKTLGTAAVFIIGMISVAAVMRDRVNTLTNWREQHEKEMHSYRTEHAEVHTTLDVTLQRISTLLEAYEDRLKLLEQDKRHFSHRSIS